MTYIASINPTSTINLQATLSASSSGLGEPVIPHAPITCAQGPLFFHEDGTFACEHAQAPPGDQRTQACVDHSIAILILEMLREKEDADAG